MSAGPNNCSSCLFEEGRQASCSTFEQPFLFREFPLYGGINVRYCPSLFDLEMVAIKLCTCLVSSSIDYRGDRSYKPNPRLARVLDILFILQAEHEMNCSTAAARHLSSRYYLSLVRDSFESAMRYFLIST